MRCQLSKLWPTQMTPLEARAILCLTVYLKILGTFKPSTHISYRNQITDVSDDYISQKRNEIVSMGYRAKTLLLRYYYISGQKAFFRRHKSGSELFLRNYINQKYKLNKTWLEYYCMNLNVFLSIIAL